MTLARGLPVPSPALSEGTETSMYLHMPLLRQPNCPPRAFAAGEVAFLRGAGSWKHSGHGLDGVIGVVSGLRVGTLSRPLLRGSGKG